MREIKFRAWDPQACKMIYKPETLKRVTYNETDNGFHMGRSDKDGSGWVQFNIMQYTGLKDKNGKDIYEGDILNIGEVNGYGDLPYDGVNKIRIVSVYWEDFRASWAIKFNKNANTDLYRFANNNTNKSNFAEVIGNIHESPELCSPPLSTKD